MNSTIERIRKIQEILDEKSYLQGGARLPYWRRAAHFWVVVAKSFQKNRGPNRAAALAYTTVLSLIPILAVVVSISTGFLQNDQGNIIQKLLDQLVAYAAPQLDLIQTGDGDADAMNRQAVVAKIQSYINTINSGTLGLTAGVALVGIAIMVLSSVEATFNDIWGVTRGRSWSARIVQYWAAITLAPIFIVTAVALTTSAQILNASKSDPAKKEALMGTAGTKVTNSAALVTNTVAVRGGTNESSLGTAPAGLKEVVTVTPQKPGFFRRALIFFLNAPVLGALILKLLPFVVLTIFLALFYRLMPATSVNWSAAFAGGLAGGVLLQLNNLFSVIYLSRVVTYSKIYGSLGAVPIFLLGLYFSWTIILLGAQVAYSFQNRTAYLAEKQAETIHQRGREFVALRLAALAAQRFHSGQEPPSLLDMSDQLGIPAQLSSSVLAALVQAKLIVEVQGDATGYAPARPIDRITIEDILAALRNGSGSDLVTAEDASRAVVRQEYDRVTMIEMQAAGSVSLQTLVTRIESMPPTPAALEKKSEREAA